MSDPRRPSNPEARLAIGEMAVKAYGKYYLIKKLAEGGMAEIFLAKQLGVEGFEKNVVIKRMLPHLSALPDFVNMFLDEAHLAASLAHPNIVHISDLGLADGCYFICMEYLPGEDLATILRAGKRRAEHPPFGVILRILSQAAIGLHFAHEAVDSKGEPMQLVHRDVSPSNIFVTYNGQVKLLDFGIAKAGSRVTMTDAGVVKGKYQYMSPEQAYGDAIDRRSDVFSLGIALYEALTGVRPFARDTDLAILNAVLAGQYQPVRAIRPDLPGEIEHIVDKAMAKNRDQRFPTALAMAHAMEAFMGAAASTGGGSQELTLFMNGFFGPERVKSKMRIESLSELAARGIDVPGYQKNLAQTAIDNTQIHDPLDKTQAMGAPRLVLSAQARRVKWLMAGALVLGIGGTIVAMKVASPRNSNTQTVSLNTLPEAGVSEIDAGLTDSQIDAGGTTASIQSDAGAAPLPVKVAPVTLTPQMVQRSILQSKTRIQKCFKTHKDELPSPQGKLTVTFAIASSGRVSSASTDLPGKQVSACIETVVRSMLFPRHVDLEVRVPIALSWDVR